LKKNGLGQRHKTSAQFVRVAEPGSTALNLQPVKHAGGNQSTAGGKQRRYVLATGGRGRETIGKISRLRNYQPMWFNQKTRDGNATRRSHPKRLS